MNVEIALILLSICIVILLLLLIIQQSKINKLNELVEFCSRRLDTKTPDYRHDNLVRNVTELKYQFEALTDTLGYDVTKIPFEYKVTKKD